VRAVPAVPYRDPGNYQHVAGRLADELEVAIWANQFDNTANREIHERTTGPEIWAQTGGGVDAFVAATGTGGTLAGVGRALKAHKPEVRIVLADPHGSGLYEWAAHGEIKVEGSSITEGIGNSRVTANLEGTTIDDAVRIGDADAVAMVYRLLSEEGLYLGSSSGINVCAAVEVARASRSRPHHRHRSLRRRRPLPLEALQSRVAGCQGSRRIRELSALDRCRPSHCFISWLPFHY
jgi:cysteine synthase A